MSRGDRQSDRLKDLRRGWCNDHRKYLFGSRKDARRAGKADHRGEHVNEYRCQSREGMWHIGHLAGQITAGLVGRDVYRHPSPES